MSQRGKLTVFPCVANARKPNDANCVWMWIPSCPDRVQSNFLFVHFYSILDFKARCMEKLPIFYFCINDFSFHQLFSIFQLKFRRAQWNAETEKSISANLTVDEKIIKSICLGRVINKQHPSNKWSWPNNVPLNCALERGKWQNLPTFYLLLCLLWQQQTIKHYHQSNFTWNW